MRRQNTPVGLSVEVSDDSGGVAHAGCGRPTIANLRANGQEHWSRIAWNRRPRRRNSGAYLGWHGSAPNFELTSVLAEPAASPTERARAALDVIGILDPKSPQEYTFDLSAHPPVSRLNVLLPDANTVMDIEVSSRSATNAPWRVVTRSGFYRIKTQDAEQQTALLQVGPDTDRYWRARILGTGSPQAPLRLHVEWIPNEVTFLAQGHAPFLLAYGNASANRAEADLSHLPSTLDIGPATSNT